MADTKKVANHENITNPHCVIVVARHGERKDYVVRDSGSNWVQSAEKPWDPPLSDHELEQGNALGKHLFDELKRLELPPIVGIYTSPLLRCRQTAVQARKGILEKSNVGAGSGIPEQNASSGQLPRVRVEMGLVESINDAWYRSWACKRSNGTWGLRKAFEGPSDIETLHPACLKPVQAILSDWSDQANPGDDDESDFINNFDVNYESLTKIEQPYTFHPPFLESDATQRVRMRMAVTSVAAQHLQGHNNGTILFLSHGAPVTHLFESLTGRGRQEHGSSSYCCYSIYKISPESLLTSLHSSENSIYWEALQVNQANYLNEEIVQEKHV